MADISKIQLPGSGEIYNIKDAVAREAIAGGVSFIIAWDGASTPVPANIPAGVKVVYNNTTYTGTLSAETTGTEPHAQAGAFYLVRTSSVEYVLLKTQPGDWTTKWTDYYSYNSSTGVYTKLSGASAPTFAADTYYKAVHDSYDEYVPVGTTGSKTWEKIGDTAVDLSDVVTGVTLNKQTDKALGEATTFTNASSSVTFTGTTTDNVLGEATTFALTSGTVTVTPTTTNIKATANGGGAAWNSKDQKTVVTGYTIAAANKDTFVKSVSAETNKKLDTTSVPNVTAAGTASSWTFEEKSIPNVTAAGNASTWSFAMGSGDASETLIISGANSTAPTLGTAIKVQSKSGGSNGTAPTLGTAITVATGTTSANGTGDAVVTGVTIGASADAITSLPDPSTATVIGSSSTFTNTQPTVSLATGATAGTGVISVATGITSASVGTGITVGTNDIVTAVTGLGTGTAAAQNITVGTNDKVDVLTNSTSLSVTKGNS